MKRALVVLIMLSALLVFVNACEAESDASAAFRSGQYAESELDNTLDQRHADQVHYMALECGSLVLCVGALGVLTFRT